MSDIIEDFFCAKEKVVQAQIADDIEEEQNESWEYEGKIYSKRDKEEFLKREVRALMANIIGTAYDRTEKLAEVFGIDVEDLWMDIATQLDKINWYTQEIE